jgi:hypothetical protein
VHDLYAWLSPCAVQAAAWLSPEVSRRAAHLQRHKYECFICGKKQPRPSLGLHSGIQLALPAARAVCLLSCGCWPPCKYHSLRLAGTGFTACTLPLLCADAFDSMQRVYLINHVPLSPSAVPKATHVPSHDQVVYSSWLHYAVHSDVFVRNNSVQY